MGKQFPAARVLVVLILTTYLFTAIFSTGQVVAPAGVLILVLVLWFLVYRFRYKDLGNQELVTKMYTDLAGTLEGMKERIAQEEAQKRLAEEREKQARWERERRRASMPTRDPSASKYAEMIENRVREGERIRGGSKGQ
jgi:ABC-type siderophore export system fused ATPase/permease subunit